MATVLLTSLLVVGLHRGPGVAEEDDADAPGFLVISPCENPPVVDGRLDDDCWQSAAVATDFVLVDEDAPAGKQTTVRITYDEDRIYLGFRCDEPDARGIVAEETEHDGQVCRDDCVDVFLDPSRDHKNYFHFIVNPKGVTSDSSVELVDDFIDLYYDWEPEYDVRTSIGDGAWFVEMALPFSTLMTGVVRPSVYEERKEEERSAFSLLEPPAVTSGTVWNVNLCRRTSSGSSSWSPVCDKLYSPYQFGHLVFAGDLDEDAVRALERDVAAAEGRILAAKNAIERERLRPILEEIAEGRPCRWRDVSRRGMFMGFESEDGAVRIPNYARLDGQGRVMLPETVPPLSQEVMEGILAVDTPRYVFDPKRLADLRKAIEEVPFVGKQWEALEAEAWTLLETPVSEFVPTDMQSDRNCVSREAAKSAGAGYGLLGSIRAKCALVYAITGDERYARKAWEAQSCLMDHFEKYQVFRAASNWYSVWDASYEVYSSTFAYDMIADSGVLSREDAARFVEFIRRLAYRVDYCVRYSEMIGNHQFMWTGNLGCMALYFPSFPESARWLGDVEDRMPRLYADILSDGGQVERSPGHHIFGLGFLCRYAMARKKLCGEDAFTREYGGRSLEMTLDWMAKIATPLGEIPAVNDSKRPMLGSHLFVPDMIGTFDKGEYLRAGKIDPSALPLDHLVPDDVEAKDPPWTSLLLPDTGLAIMRDGWDERSHYLLFDYGGHGAWHGHYDKMNIIMCADGVGWVLDAGSSPHYCVYIKEHNEWHKQTIAHNTVQVDGRSQEATTGVLRRWETCDDFDLVSASHDGYEGMVHTRTVFHPRGGYFVVSDWIRSSDAKKHDYSWLLHVQGLLGEHGPGCIAFEREGRGLLVLPADPETIDAVSVAKGLCIDTTGERKEPVRSDGRWTPGDPGWGYIPYIGLEKATDAPETGYLVVLYPYADAKERPEVVCTQLVDERGDAVGVRLRHGDLEDVYIEKKPGVGETVEISLDGIRTDAAHVFFRRQEGRIVKAAIVGGTKLLVDGEAVDCGRYR